MNKTLVTVVVAIVIIGGAGLVIANQSVNTPANNSTSEPQNNDNHTGSTDNHDTETKEETAESNSVIIHDFAFSPAKITVKKGTTVTWTNDDTAKHDIAPDNPSDEFKKSNLLAKGETYSVTFDTVGTYTYHCTPHPFMKGSVEVTE